jgi:integrase/recombinase XerD
VWPCRRCHCVSLTRDQRFYAVHRHRAAGGIPHGDQGARHRLARRELGGATVRHRLAALLSLFEYLCEKNAVTHNPVKGVKRPKAESGEGKTPAIGDHQARELLTAPGDETVKEKRDRALSALPYHALRREELCKPRVRDFRHNRARFRHVGRRAS